MELKRSYLTFGLFIFGIIFISGCAVEEIPKEISQDITDVEQVSLQDVTEDISIAKEDFEDFLGVSHVFSLKAASILGFHMLCQ